MRAIPNWIYQYKANDRLMTESETDFFKTLIDITKDRYYVFPQVHLSAILTSRFRGKMWKYAFGHINGKSVDYVLCDKLTLKPIYAIELDDFTHKYKNRIVRDREVERIFQHANMPLVRFSNYASLSRDDIIAQFEASRETVS